MKYVCSELIRSNLSKIYIGALVNYVDYIPSSDFMIYMYGALQCSDGTTVRLLFTFHLTVAQRAMIK